MLNVPDCESLSGPQCVEKCLEQHLWVALLPSYINCSVQYTTTYKVIWLRQVPCLVCSCSRIEGAGGVLAGDISYSIAGP